MSLLPEVFKFAGSPEGVLTIFLFILATSLIVFLAKATKNYRFLLFYIISIISFAGILIISHEPKNYQSKKGKYYMVTLLKDAYRNKERSFPTDKFNVFNGSISTINRLNASTYYGFNDFKIKEISSSEYRKMTKNNPQLTFMEKLDLGLVEDLQPAGL